MSGIVTDMVGRGNLITLIRVFHARGYIPFVYSAYNELSFVDHLFKEGNMSEHLPFLQGVARCLVRGRCTIMSRMQYFISIVNQFFDSITVSL